MKKARVATMWLDACSGCHMSFLDIDEALLEIAPKIELVYGPLVDAQEFPEDVDVCIIEGAIGNQDDVERVQRARERSRILVALGDCATTGNVPSMRNPIPVKTILQRVYIDGADAQKVVPSEGVPALMRHVRPLHELVKIDLHVPGCPPPASAILYVVGELLAGRMPDLKSKVRFG